MSGSRGDEVECVNSDWYWSDCLLAKLKGGRGG